MRRERPIDEELDCIRRVRRLCVGTGARHAERSDGILVFAAQAQGYPTRDEHVRARAAPEELGDDCSCVNDLLEVVEYEQCATGGEAVFDRLEERPSTLASNSERLCDRGDDLVGCRCVGERHEEHAVGICIRSAGGSGDGEPALADPARSRQRQQSNLVAFEPGNDFVDFRRSPDEPRQLRRKLHGADRLGPWRR